MKEVISFIEKWGIKVFSLTPKEIVFIKRFRTPEIFDHCIAVSPLDLNGYHTVINSCAGHIYYASTQDDPDDEEYGSYVLIHELAHLLDVHNGIRRHAQEEFGDLIQIEFNTVNFLKAQGVSLSHQEWLYWRESTGDARDVLLNMQWKEDVEGWFIQGEPTFKQWSLDLVPYQSQVKNWKKSWEILENDFNRSFGHPVGTPLPSMEATPCCG